MNLATATRQHHHGHLRALAVGALLWAALLTVILTQPNPRGRRLLVIGCVLVAAGALAISWWKRTNPLLRQLTVTIGMGLALAAVAVLRIPLNDPGLAETPHTPHPTRAASVFGYPGRAWVDLRLADGSLARAWVDTPEAKQLVPTQRVMVSGVLAPADPTRPQQWTLRPKELTPVGEQPWTVTWFRAMATLRARLHDAALQHPQGSLVPGFAVGDTSLVNPELDAAMLETSLTHLTAVSGANCALILAAVHALIPRRSARLWVGILALAAFVSLIGPDSSVLRAAVMAWVLLFTRFGGGGAPGLHTLGIAVVLLLCVDPRQAVAPGFALSVAATAGILILSPPCTAWLTRRRIPPFLALPLTVTLAAQIACAPILLLLQPGISIVALPANLVAAPLAPWGTALGLGAAITLAFSHTLGTALVAAAALPAALIEQIAFTLAGVPWGRVPWPGGITGAILLSLVLVLLGSTWGIRSGAVKLGVSAPVLRPHRAIAGPKSGTCGPLWRTSVRTVVPARARLISAMTSTAACTIIVAVSVLTPVASWIRTPNDWVFLACDVGQGDAFLIRDRSDPETVLLVDTGETPERLRACLTRFDVTHLTLAILTHDDRDHVGGVGALAGLTTAALIAPDLQNADDGPRPLRRELETLGIQPLVGSAGMTVQLIEQRAHHGPAANVSHPPPKPRGIPTEGITVTVLAPDGDRMHTDTNAASIVARVDTEHTSALLLGDTGEREQQRLLWFVDAGWLDVDILKVAHHGSSDADHSLPRLTDARYGVVSVGASNSYGHPTRESLQSLEAAGTVPLRTDELGTIAITADGRVWVSGPAASEGKRSARPAAVLPREPPEGTPNVDSGYPETSAKQRDGPPELPGEGDTV